MLILQNLLSWERRIYVYRQTFCKDTLDHLTSYIYDQVRSHTPKLRMVHRLVAISKLTPLLLKARYSSKMMPAYPTPDRTTIAISFVMKTCCNDQVYGRSTHSITIFISAKLFI